MFNLKFYIRSFNTSVFMWNCVLKFVLIRYLWYRMVFSVSKFELVGPWMYVYF
jgi:hypothetical protein